MTSNRQIFREHQYEYLHRLVFRLDYPGYKPTAIEIPNGDGRRDDDKKFAHVATKYFRAAEQASALTPYLLEAHQRAVEAARFAGFPEHLMPDLRYSALRVLDYPSGAVSNRHTDFDLFTLMCYRDQPDKFRDYDRVDLEAGVGTKAVNLIRQLNAQAHLGEIAEVEGLGTATSHEVLLSETRQRSIVYFAIPDHDTVLKTGQTVRDWLNDRMARSHTEFKKYE